MAAHPSVRFSCPHAPACVPCPLRGSSYREQLAGKRRRVEAALGGHPRLAALPVDDVIGSRDLFGYRNVAKLAVRARRDGSLRAGVYAPGTHRLVDAEACAVQHPALNAVIAATLSEARTVGVEAYDERSGSGELRYVVARYSAWKRRTMLTLVTASDDVSRLRELSRRIVRRFPTVAGIVVNHNAGHGNVIFGPRFATLQRSATLLERYGFLEVQASPASFLQPNAWTARRIYETALQRAAPQPDDVVVDLYCGVGPISLYLATRARLVVGIEESPSAVRDARANQRRNAFHNLRFEQGRGEDALPRVRAELRRASIVTLNPPRWSRAASSTCPATRIRWLVTSTGSRRSATAPQACSRSTCSRRPSTSRSSRPSNPYDESRPQCRLRDALGEPPLDRQQRRVSRTRLHPAIAAAAGLDRDVTELLEPADRVLQRHGRVALGLA